MTGEVVSPATVGRQELASRRAKARQEVESRRPKRNLVEVTCSFCGGKGKDPFGIMSPLSTCCVCKGSGVVEVEEPYCRCAHCRGTGAIKRLTCTACGGTGFVHVPEEPAALCPTCKGTGDDPSDWAIPCWKCRGRGWVPVSRLKTNAK